MPVRRQDAASLCWRLLDWAWAALGLLANTCKNAAMYTHHLGEQNRQSTPHTGKNTLGTTAKTSPSSRWGSGEGGPGETRHGGAAFLGLTGQTQWGPAPAFSLLPHCFFLLLIEVLALAFQGFQVWGGRLCASCLLGCGLVSLKLGGSWCYPSRKVCKLLFLLL